MLTMSSADIILYQFIGKSLPTRSLQDDLNDFLALVPLDEVLGIALDYLANDEQVQDFVVYLQSEEFHKIILTVEDVKELKDVSIKMQPCSFTKP